jgi:hypothetical protein
LYYLWNSCWAEWDWNIFCFSKLFDIFFKVTFYACLIRDWWCIACSWGHSYQWLLQLLRSLYSIHVLPTKITSWTQSRSWPVPFSFNDQGTHNYSLFELFCVLPGCRVCSWILCYAIT